MLQGNETRYEGALCAGGLSVKKKITQHDHKGDFLRVSVFGNHLASNHPQHAHTHISTYKYIYTYMLFRSYLNVYNYSEIFLKLHELSISVLYNEIFSDTFQRVLRLVYIKHWQPSLLKKVVKSGEYKTFTLIKTNTKRPAEIFSLVNVQCIYVCGCVCVCVCVCVLLYIFLGCYSAFCNKPINKLSCICWRI